MKPTILFGVVVLSLLQTIVALPAVDIPGTLIEQGDFKILMTALVLADLVPPLKGPGPFTVFAPTDAAFAKLPPAVVANLLKPENRKLLIEVLTFHVVNGRALKAADIIALKPPFQLTMMDRIVSRITKDGENIKIDNGTVIKADIIATNGVIHAIDQVLFPPDIVQIAVADGRFKTLVTLLVAADLVEPLKRSGPFTVFAPPDTAFAKLPPGTIDDLLKPENKPKLVKILTYHVVDGKALTVADIIEMNPPFKLEMLNGFPTQITKNGNLIKVNNSTVIIADVIALNGVIHAIDTVLLPA